MRFLDRFVRRPAVSPVAEASVGPALRSKAPGWTPAPFLPEAATHDSLLAETLPLVSRRRCVLAWNDASRVARMVLALDGAGAASVRVAHAELPPHVDQALIEAGRLLGCEERAAKFLEQGQAGGRRKPVDGMLDADLPPVWWLARSIDQRGFAAEAGVVDVVVDGSQLIHWPESLARLKALARTGARHVVLETPVVVPSPGLLACGFRPGSIWHATSMTPAQSAAMNVHWRDLGVTLPQYERFPSGFTAQQVLEAGLGGSAWWSFFDSLGLEALLRRAGLRLLRQRRVWDGRALVAIAEQPPGAPA